MPAQAPRLAAHALVPMEAESSSGSNRAVRERSATGAAPIGVVRPSARGSLDRLGDQAEAARGLDPEFLQRLVDANPCYASPKQEV
jgi:hypothetical protein